MLASAAQKGASLDKRQAPILAEFAANGKFVRDLTISEEDLLERAIAAEQRSDVAAEAGAYCPTCGELRLSCKC